MRRLTLATVLTLIGVLVVGQFGAGAAPSPVPFTLADYNKMDKDLVQDAAAAGVKVTGKQGKSYAGYSYKSPYRDGSVGRLDMRGHGLKGLAILVDWPTNGDGSSQVPGVDYAPLPQDLFNDLVNGDTYNPYTLDMFNWLATLPDGTPAPTNLTMKNYYDEVSYGQFSMTVDMVGWYTLPKPYEYYLGQDQGFYNANGDARMGELVRDALAAADAAGVDFSQYAVPAKPGDLWLYGDATEFTDKDGNLVNMVVPNLFIIHRGTGAEYSLDPSIIWSHKWDILSATYFGHYYQTGTFMNEADLEYAVHDGVAINTYNIVPEVGQDITEYFTGPNGIPKRPPSPPYVGVFAHEFGHVLGLPDLYDYGYDSEGVGMFSLMAAGSYGRTVNGIPVARWYSGNSPVHIEPWGKYYLGFVEPTVISETTTGITLRPVSEYPDIYRIEIPGSNGSEYFMIENRQQNGWDKGLEYNVDGKALHGLVVWQVDENVMMRADRINNAQSWDLNKRGASVKSTTSDNGETHYAVSVVQADGRFDMEKYWNDGDAGDVFPGKTGKTMLLSSPKSAPNTLSWVQWKPGTQATGIELHNIVEHEDGTITLDVVYK